MSRLRIAGSRLRALIALTATFLFVCQMSASHAVSGHKVNPSSYLSLGKPSQLVSMQIESHKADEPATPCANFIRFEPVSIRDNGTDSTRMVVAAGSDTASVTLMLKGPFTISGESGCDKDATIDLFDDGTHGDSTAHDGIFSIDGIHWDPGKWPTCRNYSYATGPVPGQSRFSIGDVIIRTGTGATVLPYIDHFLNVLDTESFVLADTIRAITPDIQASTSAINIVDDEMRIEGALGQWGSFSDLSSLTRKLYQTTPDAYDFLTMLSTTQVICSGWRFVGVHFNVKVDWSGTGQGKVDLSDMYGSRGKLLGINVVSEQPTDIGVVWHETLHQWGAALSGSLGLADGAHWLTSTSVGGVLGGCALRDNGDGTFTALGSWRDTRRVPELELYLMGLLSANAVSPIVVSNSIQQSFCQPGATIRGPFREVSIADVVAQFGSRLPGVETSQRHFRMALVVTSAGRLLTPLEMTLYGRYADVLSGDLQPIGSRAAPSFAELTGYRASLESELLWERLFLPMVMEDRP